jgi:hypothetical protein
MQENLKMYEDKIGKVEEAESPQGIGFKAWFFSALLYYLRSALFAYSR